MIIIIYLLARGRPQAPANLRDTTAIAHRALHSPQIVYCVCAVRDCALLLFCSDFCRFFFIRLQLKSFKHFSRLLEAMVANQAVDGDG